MANNMKERDIFAKTLFFEAGSTCDMLEVYWIAWSIRNRVERQTWYGKNYTEVCLKQWQYSCWNGKTLEEIESIDLDGDFRWMMCLMVAEYIMGANEKCNPFNMYKMKATHYYEPTLCNPPSWIKSDKMKRLPTISGLKHIYFLEK